MFPAEIVDLVKEITPATCATKFRRDGTSGFAIWNPRAGKTPERTIFCNGPEYDNGASAESGHIVADLGFEHLFTGHAGFSHGFREGGRAPHPEEARFLMWMSQPQNLREYQEKTRENIQQLMGGCAWWTRLCPSSDSGYGLRERKILKRGSMRFWLCLSLMLAAGSGAGRASTSRNAVPHNPRFAIRTKLCSRDCVPAMTISPRRKNDSSPRNFQRNQFGIQVMARRLFRARNPLGNRRRIHDSEFPLTTLGSKQGKCSERRPDFLDPRNWLSGLGLRLGDSQDRVIGLYGEPNSSGPAAKNGQDLDLMFYQFDWAGSEVPQVMEVLCARTRDAWLKLLWRSQACSARN